MTADLPLKG